MASKRGVTGSDSGSPQLICFSYHKSGTSLFLHVMTKVCQRLGLTLGNYYGLVERLDQEPDVVLLPHSMLRDPLDRPYRAIRLIRDPRDIWVSGYLYHLRCDEGWCRNTVMDPAPPIQWPRVDYSVAHWPESWKRRKARDIFAYLVTSRGRSVPRSRLADLYWPELDADAANDNLRVTISWCCVHCPAQMIL